MGEQLRERSEVATVDTGQPRHLNHLSRTSRQLGSAGCADLQRARDTLADYLSIFDEFRGTCSTKHAILAALANEHHQDVQLKMVICKLDQNVDKTVGKLLLQLKVPYFPEAHCYIKCSKGALDLTFPDQDIVPSVSVLKEYDISPKDIGDKKVSIHHEYIKFWMKGSMFSQ